MEDNYKTYPYLLEKKLKEKYPSKNIRVINAGVGGYTSWESLLNLQFRVLDLSPDLVLIYHGTNDVHPRLVPVNLYASDNSAYRKQYSAPTIPWYMNLAIVRLLGPKRKYGLSSMVVRNGHKWYTRPNSRTYQFNPNDLLKSNKPIYFYRNLKMMASICKDFNIPIVLATWAYNPNLKDYAGLPHYIEAYAEANTVIKKVAQEYNLHTIEFAKQMSQDPKYWADGRHVNEAGALLKANIFSKALAKLNMGLA